MLSEGSKYSYEICKFGLLARHQQLKSLVHALGWLGQHLYLPCCFLSKTCQSHCSETPSAVQHLSHSITLSTWCNLMLNVPAYIQGNFLLSFVPEVGEIFFFAFLVWLWFVGSRQFFALINALQTLNSIFFSFYLSSGLFRSIDT